MRKVKRKVPQDPKTELVTVSLSPKEKELLDNYLSRKKIKSRSAFIRRTILSTVLKDMGQNKATLFDFEDPIE